MKGWQSWKLNDEEECNDDKDEQCFLLPYMTVFTPDQPYTHRLSWVSTQLKKQIVANFYIHKKAICLKMWG